MHVTAPRPIAPSVRPAPPFDARAYWESRLRAHAGLAGVGYTRLGRRWNERLYAVRRHVFRDAIAGWHLAGRPLRVLDVGSGTGFYVREWLRAGAREVVACDLADVAAERLATEFPGVPVHRLDIGAADAAGALRRRHRRFDVVSAFDMLFHIVDDAAYVRALRNCFALTRPGGWFVFSENLLGRGRVAVPHMVSRSRHEVETLVREAGFVVVDRRPMFVLMNYPVDTAGWVGSLARLAWAGALAPCALGGRAGEWYGGALGALIAPFERRLARALSESPTTEIVLCRRPIARPVRSALPNAAR